VSLIASLVLLMLAVLPAPASAWNIPGHMLSGAIAYQMLQQESPQTIDKVKALLARLQDVPVADHGLVLFMQAAKWADDIRSNDKPQHRALWHYINWPFKPDKQPASVQTREPEPVNILTAMVENERVVKNDNPERKAIALAWLFHLVGDIHQPLHTVQLFTSEYPKGDRDGNEICVRVTQAGQPMDLHRFWDGVITSSSNVTRLRTMRRRFETARSFSGVSSPNWRILTLSRGLKRATRLRRSLLTKTGGLGVRRVGIRIARWL